MLVRLFQEREDMMIKILILALTTEALVELFFTAAPLQPIRRAMIERTPLLNSVDFGHLLNCKFCVSVWFGFFTYFTFLLFGDPFFTFFCFWVIIFRLSNYFHVLFSYLRETVLKIRADR